MASPNMVGQSRAWGRGEFILCLATAVAIGSFVAGTFFGFGPNVQPGFSWPVAVVFAIVGVGVAATVVLMATTNLWLLMGSTRLVSRLFVVAMINIVPCALFVVGAAFGFLRFQDEGEAQLLLAIFTQRLLTLLIFAVIGCCLQYLGRWRIAGPLGRSVSHQRFQASIGDIFMLTTIVAGVLGCFSYWMQVFDANRRDQRLLSELLQGVATVTVLELVVVLILLLFPIFLSYGAPWVRRHYPSTVALWTCLWAVITSVLVMFVEGELAVWVFVVCVGFAILAFFVLSLWSKLGFSIRKGYSREADTRDASGSELEMSPRKSRWIVRGMCALAASAVVFFYVWFDVPVIMESGDFSTARKYAWMIRNERAFPRGWNGQGMAFGATPRFLFHGESKKLTKMLRALVLTSPTLIELDVHVNGKVSNELLHELNKRTFQQLKFTFDQIDDAEFDAFCRKADVRNVSLDAVSLARLQSLQHIKTLASVRQSKVVPWTKEHQKAVAALPGISSVPLQIRLVNGDLGDTTGLQGVSALSLLNSRISDQTILQLSKLKNLSQLYLIQCEMDSAAANAFAHLTLDDLVWGRLCG